MADLEPLAAFAAAAALGLALTPLAGRLSVRVGAVAKPTERGMHEVPIPYLGGVAMLAAVLITGFVFLGGDAEIRAVFYGAIVIVVVGVIDDALDLHPALKLAGQVGAALIPALNGTLVTDITLPLLGTVEFGAAAVPLTVFGIVALMNVINLIDGIDGLAAGICAIAAIAFALIAVSLGRNNAAVLAALTAGAAIGFLPWNFSPARIFMGDSGANLLGLLLACAAAQGLLKTTAIIALAVPLVLLAVPILDTGFVVARRIRHGVPFYRADNEHFHHRMARIGFSHRRTTIYLYGWTSLLAAFALALALVPARVDGVIQPLWLALLIAIGLAAVAASFYVVYLLEIFVFARRRGASAEPADFEHAMDD